MLRKSILLWAVSFLALFAHGAVYDIKLNPGDKLTVEAPLGTTPIPTPVPVATVPFGVNLAGPNDWDMSAFTRVSPDVALFSRWIGTNRLRVLTAGDVNIQYEDPPGSGILKWSTFGSKYPKIAGTYLLSFDGVPVRTDPNDPTKIIDPGTTVTASSAAIQKFLNFGGKCTAELVISRDDVNVDLQFSGPVSKVVLLRPGYTRGTTEVVTSEFEAWVSPFSFIRYMDVQDSNWHFPDAPSYAKDPKLGVAEYFAMRNAGMTGPTIQAVVPYARVNNVDLTVTVPLTTMLWADRASDTAQSFHRTHGVSPEWIGRVANETNKDVWFNLPVTFTDDYCYGLARLYKAQLNPNINIYLEYGNENPWNDIPKFGQARAIIPLAQEALKTFPQLNNDGQNPWYMGTRYVLWRTIRAAQIFKEVWGDAEFAKRVRPVFASQHTTPGYAGNALLWGLKYSDLSLLDGIAFAPYVAKSTGTVPELQAALRSDFTARYNATSWQAAWRGVADAYGAYMKEKRAKVYGYECGFDLGQGITNLANRIGFAHDPNTEALTYDYLSSMYFGGGMDSVAWFNGISSRGVYTPAWGLTHDPLAVNEPMYKAAVAFAKQPAITGGLKVAFYKDSTFTTPVLFNNIPVTTTVPHIFHYYQAWGIGSIVGRTDVTGLLYTRVVDGYARFSGKYTGTGKLVVEQDPNDKAVLTHQPDGTFVVDYSAIFSGTGAGSGTAWVRLLSEDAAGKRTLVRQTQLIPQ